jgi:PHP-associated
LASIKVDIHIHSSFSHCSSLSVDSLIEQARKSCAKVVVCTDHGDLSALDKLMDELPDAIVVPAMELEATEGDFLVFSTDSKLINELTDFEGSVSLLARDKNVAVVWAHPCLSQHVDFAKLAGKNTEGGLPDEQALAAVLPYIDGIEYFNGTILDLAASGLVKPTYFKNLGYLGKKYNLACTGGSDAREKEMISKVWTEFPASIKTTADFVHAIKGAMVRPDYDREYFNTQIEYCR